MATKAGSKRTERQSSGVQITERRLLTQEEYDSIIHAGKADSAIIPISALFPRLGPSFPIPLAICKSKC